MDRIETENALIDRTFLGFEDHGIMTCFIYLKYRGGGQGFGGYGLSTARRDRDGNAVIVGHSFGMEFILRTLKAVGVDSWEKLPGHYVRARHDHGKVYAIGHIIEDKWFEPDKLSEEMRDAEQREGIEP